MRKRRIIVMCIMAVLTMLLMVGCGESDNGDQDLSSSKYLGSWKATSVAVGEKSGGIDTGDIELTLKEDGTGEFYAKSDEEGEEENNKITWAETDDGFEIKGDVNLKFTDDGDNIKADFLGADMIFERVE